MLKGIDDEHIKELVKKLSGIGADALADYLESLGADTKGTFKLNYSCDGKGGMNVQPVFNVTIHTPEGDVPVEVPITDAPFSCSGKGVLTWQHGIDNVCGCCPKQDD